jgi:hypothetical protein
LEEALNQLREGDLDGAREFLEDFIAQNQLAQDFDHLKRAERALDRGMERGLESGDEMDFEHSSDESGEYGDYNMAGDPHGGSGGSPGEFEGGEYLDSEGMGSNSSVGSGRGTESEAPRNRIAETNAPPTRISGQSGEGGVRRAYVRSLPLKSDALIPVEEVIATYQKRAEDSLLREEIPPHNRDIVRAYFLSIGLVEDSSGSEGKDEQRER